MTTPNGYRDVATERRLLAWLDEQVGACHKCKKPVKRNDPRQGVSDKRGKIISTT